MLKTCTREKVFSLTLRIAHSLYSGTPMQSMGKMKKKLNIICAQYQANSTTYKEQLSCTGELSSLITNYKAHSAMLLESVLYLPVIPSPNLEFLHSL